MKQHRPLLDTRVCKCLKNNVGKPENTLQTLFHGIKGYQPSDLIRYNETPELLVEV